ncbi:hypothetical protein AAC387_Pa02g4649 [Persea americana]
MSPLSLGIPSQPRLLNPPTFTPYLSPTPPNQPPTFQDNPPAPGIPPQPPNDYASNSTFALSNTLQPPDSQTHSIDSPPRPIFQLAMDPNLAVPDDKNPMDANANPYFCYPPPPPNQPTSAASCSWVLDSPTDHFGASTTGPPSSGRFSRGLQHPSCQQADDGSASGKFHHWQPSRYFRTGQSKFGVAPPTGVLGRRHALWNRSSSGHDQQHHSITTMAKFKVVRPNMRLELKLRGLNLDSWTFLQQFLTL